MALPLALVALVILAALVAAFALLSQSEAIIGANHRHGAVARAMAESGIERAIWALSSPGSGVTAPAAAAVAAAPYDGSTYVSLGTLGGFTVQLTGLSATQVGVLAVGWHRDNTTTANAHRRIQVVLERLPSFEPPCALCVNGPLQVTGASTIDARASLGSACGSKLGTWSSGETSIERGTARIYAGDEGGTHNVANIRGVDYVQNAEGFTDFALTNDDLAALRALARAQGTYYQGPVTFNSSNRLPARGIVFVDTTDASVVEPGTSDATLASVTLSGGARPSGSPFQGWLVVNGNLSISGSFGGIRGVVYAVNHLSTTGFGTDSLVGVAVAHEKRGDGSAGFSAGNATITYDCTAARGDGQVPDGWFLKVGTYREVSD